MVCDYQARAFKNYYNKNREAILQQKKEYYLKNRDAILQRKANKRKQEKTVSNDSVSSC